MDDAATYPHFTVTYVEAEVIALKGFIIVSLKSQHHTRHTFHVFSVTNSSEDVCMQRYCNIQPLPLRLSNRNRKCSQRSFEH